jgi:hypothetical protein
MARYDDLDTTAIAHFSIVSTVVLFILILAGRALSYGWAYSFEEARSRTARYTVSEREIARQKALLADFSTVEEPAEEGQEPGSRLVIPVSKALELVSQEIAAEPST